DGGADPAGAYFVFTGCTDEKTTTTCANDCTEGGAPAATQPGSCGADAGSDAGQDAGDDGGDASAPTPVTADGCTSCISGACGDPQQACGADTDCAAFLACVYACTDASCQDDCATTHASGKEAARELSSCAVLSCAVQCGY
ncbi:MAG TPA: hypothetical protein VIF62_31980, partial [Labilithrix sp.]